MTNENTCVSCGESIPEGRQVCPKCDTSNRQIVADCKRCIHSDICIFTEKNPDCIQFKDRADFVEVEKLNNLEQSRDYWKAKAEKAQKNLRMLRKNNEPSKNMR